VDALDLAEVDVEAGEHLEVRRGVAHAVAVWNAGDGGPGHHDAAVEAQAEARNEADLEAGAGVDEAPVLADDHALIARERAQAAVSGQQVGLEPIGVAEVEDEAAAIPEDEQARVEAVVGIHAARLGRDAHQLGLDADPAVQVHPEGRAEEAGVPGRDLGRAVRRAAEGVLRGEEMAAAEHAEVEPVLGVRPRRQVGFLRRLGQGRAGGCRE